MVTCFLIIFNLLYIKLIKIIDFLYMSISQYQTAPLKQPHRHPIHPFQLNNNKTLPTDTNRQPFLDRDNLDNKQIIPLKEYSNKFLRDSKGHEQTRTTKINAKRRLNLILKKKQLIINRTQLKQNAIKVEEGLPQTENIEQESLIRVNKLLKINHYKRMATENPESYNHNHSIIINELQNEMVLNSAGFNSSFSNASPLNRQVIPVNLFNSNERFKNQWPKQRQHLNFKKNNFISPIDEDFRQKISQSRGLELYSKIFIRNRSQMIEKMRIQSCKNRKKQILGKMTQFQQNFEARKINPIQKTKKAKNISVLGCDKFFHKKNTNILLNNEDQFEINAWETSL